MLRDAINLGRHRGVEVMRPFILSLVVGQGESPPGRPHHAPLDHELSGSLGVLLPRRDHVFRSVDACLEHGIAARRQSRGRK